MAEKVRKLTGQEKVEHYLNVWGSDKRTLVSIIRQLIFIIGIITTSFVAVWAICDALTFTFVNDSFKTVTNHIAMISVAFMAFIIVLGQIYLWTEIVAFNRSRMNRLPSIIFGMCMSIVLIVFYILTCIEIFGLKDTSRSYIYCIYLVICFSCCLFCTIYCFDAKKTNQKFNPNNKLLKSLSYTIGFLGILAVLSYILWIMWYGSGTERLGWTCFLLGRTILTLIGSIIVKLIGQIVLIAVIKHSSKYKIQRIIYLSILFAILFSLEMYLGSLFLLNGPWSTKVSLTKAIMSVTIVVVIAISAIDIAIASRYSTRLEKEVK